MKNQFAKVCLLPACLLGSLLASQTAQTATGPVTITSQPMSQIVLEGNPVTFNVGVDGTPPFTFQWFRGAAAITDATNSSFTIASAATSDNGASFHVAVTNSLGNATSSSALLTVNADTVPPTVVNQSPPAGSKIHELTAVEVFFSEQVEGVEAAD